MKREKFNCDLAREYSIEKALAKLGHFPSRKSEKEAWYLSPFRSENQASFKVSLLLNRWYDHGMGKGGNVIDLIAQLNRYSIPQVLEFLNDNSFDFSFQLPAQKTTEIKAKSYAIIKVTNLYHYALTNYLKERFIDIEVAKKYCREIHYKIKDKKYFAISFENASNGYTIRNKFFKGNLLKKDITVIKNNSKILCVFEGFIDFLSYLTLFKTDKILEDFIILNSVTSVNSCLPHLKKYDTINTFLDNDKPGKTATELIKKKHHNVIDCAGLYSKTHKDLNEYLVALNVSPKR